jgi:hypothetical protein
VAALAAAFALFAAGSGTYVATGHDYDVAFANTGTTSWRAFELVAPAGLTFLGGTTGNEGSITCTVGPPNQIVCGPIGVTVMPPQAHLTFVATTTAPATCGVVFQLALSDDGSTFAPAGGLAGTCAPPTLDVVGRTVRATPPAWRATPTAVRYRWQVCRRSLCTTVAGATGLTLRVTKREAGRVVRFVATATIDGVAVTARSAVRLAPR